MGMGRDLDAEIAQAQQARDGIEFPSNAEVQTAEGVAAFAEAQQARQQRTLRSQSFVLPSSDFRMPMLVEISDLMMTPPSCHRG
jgi:hypothetical protein